jgi:hypothetical protein
LNSHRTSNLNSKNKQINFYAGRPRSVPSATSDLLENGPDVCDTESDSENEDHGDVLSGMYTADIPVDSNGRPIDARYKLSADQASALRAQAAHQESRPSGPTTQVSAAGLKMPTTHPSPLQEGSWSQGIPILQTRTCLAINSATRRVRPPRNPRRAPMGWPPGLMNKQVIRDRRVPHQVYPKRKRAELEACDRRSVQGQRIRVRQIVALPKPES